MSLEDELIKYQDEKGKSLEYQVIEDNDTFFNGYFRG